MSMRNEGYTDIERSFIDKAVIMPPEMQQDVEQAKRYTRVVIDSKDRDTKLFPHPHEYEITLDDDIDDVVAAELLTIDVPMSQYLVNPTFCTFVVSDTTVRIPLGNYRPFTLAAAVQVAIADAGLSSFTVTYNEPTDNYTFESSQDFTLMFPNAIAKLFGFQANTLYTSEAQRISSPFRKDFDYNNYIIMTIDQFDINKSTSSVLTKSFAIITRDMQATRVSHDAKVKKRFTPPLPRLQKLRIRFYDRYGNPYNFNNMDHHFELLFESYKQKRKYQNIFLNR